jgi:hypothetical protein
MPVLSGGKVIARELGIKLMVRRAVRSERYRPENGSRRSSPGSLIGAERH